MRGKARSELALAQERAQKIYDALGLPLQWTCNVFDLVEVLGPTVGSEAFKFLEEEG